MAPPIPTVDASAVTVATAIAFNNEFFDAYQPILPDVAEELQGVMALDLVSIAEDSRYQYFETASHPRVWLRGRAISQDAFKGRSWTVENFFYGRRINWNYEDQINDQTGQLMPKVQELGMNFGWLVLRLFYQVLLASTDAELLQSIPTGPDGVTGLFSATDGAGAARYGVTNGNLLVGGGVGSAVMRQDFFRARNQIQKFLDTKGVPRYPAGFCKNFMVFYANDREDEGIRAFLNELIQGSNAGVANEVKKLKNPPELRPSTFITDNDMFVFCTDVKQKPIFKQNREPLMTNIGDFTNSDMARSTRNYTIDFFEYFGIGVGPNFNCAKINN